MIAGLSCGCVGATLDPGGPVVAVGGGGTPSSVVRECLRLARERVPSPRVVVVPHASARDERGVASAAMWREAGADEVYILSDERDAAATALERADIVWLGGGSQNRLLDWLEAQTLIASVQSAHARGALVGGTSAGAAVLGARCIAGAPEPAPYVAGAMPSRPGLNLVPTVLFDQHFAERQREGRLFTAVLEAPNLIGIGISERTAAIVHRGSVRVLGDGAVLRIDARNAQDQTLQDAATPDARRSARGIVVDILREADEVPAKAP